MSLQAESCSENSDCHMNCKCFVDLRVIIMAKELLSVTNKLYPIDASLFKPGIELEF